MKKPALVAAFLTIIGSSVLISFVIYFIWAEYFLSYGYNWSDSGERILIAVMTITAV